MHHHTPRAALLLLCIASVYAKSLDSTIRIPSLGIREACNSISDAGHIPAYASSGPSDISTDQIISDTTQSLFANEINDTADVSYAIPNLQDTGAVAERKQQAVSKKVVHTLLPPKESSVKSTLEATSSPQLHIPKNKTVDEPLANPYGWGPLTLTFVQVSLATALIGYVSMYAFYSLMAWYSVLKVCRSKILKLGAVHGMVP